MCIRVPNQLRTSYRAIRMEGLVPMFYPISSFNHYMPPTRTGPDRADRRAPSSPLSRSSRSNEPTESLPRSSSPVESDLEFDENPESRWKRLYLQEHKKRLNEQSSKKQKNE